MTGVLFFTAASLLCGLAWSPAALLAARVVQGAGAAIMTPTALSIIATTFPDGSERNKALGIWGALGGIGATTAWQRGLRSVTQGADKPPAIRQRRTNRSGWVTGGLWLPRTLSPRRKAPPCAGDIACSGSRAGEAA